MAKNANEMTNRRPNAVFTVGKIFFCPENSRNAVTERGENYARIMRRKFEASV